MSGRSMLAVMFCAAAWIFAPAAPAQTATQSAAPESFQELVTDIQRMLAELGYRPGAADGRMGERTRQAIRRYQSNTGLPVDGHPTRALRDHLRVTTGAAPDSSAPRAAPSTAAGTSPRTAAWRGEVVADALLRIAPSEASASKQRIARGSGVDVIRRQGRWLEVRVPQSGAEGWVKQVSVRSVSDGHAAPAEKKSGGFFAGLARGISRLLGGSRDTPQSQGSVTVGVRGLAPEDLESAIPDVGELEKMESYRVDEQQAFRFAAEERLTAENIEYLDVTPAAPAPSSGGRD